MLNAYTRTVIDLMTASFIAGCLNNLIVILAPKSDVRKTNLLTGTLSVSLARFVMLLSSHDKL